MSDSVQTGVDVSSPPLRVLVTNDDGFDAPGIDWLARAAVGAGLDVVVAAPLTEASGTGAALSAVIEEHGRIMVQRRQLAGMEHVPAYEVAASPAFIVLLALDGAFGAAPTVVLSGINRGANAGAAIVHSGTVGATLTASHAGLRGVAVSLDVLSPATASTASGGAAVADLDTVDDEARHWAGAAELAVRLLPLLAGTPAGTVLNLNVPDLPPGEVRGLRRATLARFGQVQISVAEAGEGFLRTVVQASTESPAAGTDLAVLAEGFATVTPIRAPGEVSEVALDLTRTTVP